MGPLRRLLFPLVASAIALGTARAADATEDADFAAFVRDFRATAIAEGISAATYDREMASVTKLPIVVERNDNQPEFSRPIWGYLESAVSDRRITDGLTNKALRHEPLEEAALHYSVDAEIIAAIWGLESAYGRIQGDHDVLSSLATLAYDGRRTSFGRTQLLSALTIIDRGYASRQQLKGSWAGAMGQTQFIPSTYLSYAIDANADGRRDLWGDYQDIFASTANYLARFGYDEGVPWGMEVILPKGFDYAQASMRTRRPVAAWSLEGVATPTGPLGDKADLNLSASIILPAGAEGPAFMVFDNFRTILRYNNATSYALAVGMLSDALAGRMAPLSTPWPTDDRPLSRTERKSLQQALAARGFDPGPIDGIIGAGTQSALRAWQQSQGLPADGYASAKTLERLTGG